MDSKERHIRENEGNADLIAKSLKAQAHERKRESTKKINRLWLWLGVLVLVAILLYWIFTFGIFGSLTDSFNG